MKLKDDVTFQDVLDSRLPYDSSTINNDNPNNWLWNLSTINVDSYYPTRKIEKK
jgi:hypothetical protein